MFNELDKLMHERPLNQTALAAWAMQMHTVLKERLPTMSSAMREANSHWMDKEKDVKVPMGLYQSLMEIWNLMGTFYDQMDKGEN